MSKLIMMKQSEIKDLRYVLWKDNNCCCPITGLDVAFNKTALDHIHKRFKSDIPSKYNGTIRTTLSSNANALAGKIENNFIRYFGRDSDVDLPTFLRNMANYLEKEPYKDSDNNYYVHPNEVIKKEKLSKSDWNRIKKYYFVLYPNRKVMMKQPTFLSDDVKLLIDDINYIIQQEKREIQIKKDYKLKLKMEKNKNKTIVLPLLMI